MSFPGRNFVLAFVPASLILFEAVSAAAHPLVIGFERFHAPSPSSAGGRLLYNELGCANCHGGETGLPARRGPALAGIAGRVKVEWLEDFLASSVEVQTGATVPHRLQENEGAATKAVAHFLGSLESKSMGARRPPRHVNGQRGKELFHTIGCVACHAPEAKAAEGATARPEFNYPSIELPKLDKKYVLASLAEFLLDPPRHRPAGRMPRFALEPQDAIDLAAYLLNFSESDGELAPGLPRFVPDPALAAQGRELAKAARCAACHDLAGFNAPAPVAIEDSLGGCLAAIPGAGLPEYDLNAEQREALRLFLTNRPESIAASLSALLTFQALNCLACHDRDGRGGPDAGRRVYFQGEPELGDSGRLPPPLTGVGRKLQREWLEKALAGHARVRPYLKTQMPAYGTAADGLAGLLAFTDQKAERTFPAGHVEAGRQLLGTLGGYSCIACHHWGERRSLGIPGLDLSDMAKRLTLGWLQEYLVDPSDYRPGTLMPSFWPDGKAASAGILNGETALQIASIYAFAQSGQGEPEGFPEINPGEYELVPVDRPIVQRAFVEGAGTHAILVGFPEGIHLAYDGLEGRPAFAWKGRFFDAYQTWFSRFPPFERPLGESVVKWPELDQTGVEVRFQGYRLDPKGVPIFLSTIDGLELEERFEPKDGRLQRSLIWRQMAHSELVVRHPEGVQVEEGPANISGNRHYYYSW